jgi:hypothetical protein
MVLCQQPFRKHLFQMILQKFIMCSFHGVHEINAHRADHVSVSPSVCTIQLKNHLIGLDEIWYKDVPLGTPLKS